MTKVKYLIMLLVTVAFMLLIPIVSNAATEYTYSDTEQGIEWSYELDNSENVVNLRCKTTTVTGEVTIPSAIDGKPVISLKGGTITSATGAFQEIVGITSVTIPDTIVTIGGRAFYKCTGLKTVTMPDSVISIGSSAFERCTGIRTLVIPDNVNTIERNAFYGCIGLTSLTLSKNLTSIGDSAFCGCTGVTTVIIPNSVTTIGEAAFRDCSGIKELTLPDNLTKISDSTFEGCLGLKSVIIPNNVTTIEGNYSNLYGAFGMCKNLEKVLIPDNVVSIGTGAFRGCSKLTIYGNDGMTSKQYAEEKGINFKYISEWNDSDVGDDITPPKVEKLQIDYSASFDYESGSGLYYVSPGTTISIHATFSEKISGTTIPTLTIKCGNGENINISNGVIAGSKIVYTYTIKDQDKGVITAVKLSGGDITDEAGNSAELSCPQLTLSIVNAFVHANGSATNPDNGGNSNGESNNGSGTGTGSQNGIGEGGGAQTGTGLENEKQNNTNKEQDTTVAPEKLPAAGLKIGMISVLSIVILGTIIMYFKYNRLRGI